jgi:hypothetical protein
VPGFTATGSQILYELILSAEPNGGDIRYRVDPWNSGNLAEGVLTSDLPGRTLCLTPHFWLNDGTTAAAVAVVSSAHFLKIGGAVRYDPAQNQMFDGVEADRAAGHSLLDTSDHVIAAEALQKAQNLDEFPSPRLHMRTFRRRRNMANSSGRSPPTSGAA